MLTIIMGIAFSMPAMNNVFVRHYMRCECFRNEKPSNKTKMCWCKKKWAIKKLLLLIFPFRGLVENFRAMVYSCSPRTVHFHWLPTIWVNVSVSVFRKLLSGFTCCWLKVKNFTINWQWDWRTTHRRCCR